MPEETTNDGQTDSALDGQIAAIDATFATEDTGSDEDQHSVDEVALDTEHPKDESSEASVDETPTKITDEEGKTTDATSDKDEVKPELTDEAKAQAEADAKEETELNELLGVKEDEPEESPVWKERHSEATRMIHEQATELNDIKAFLTSQGRELIATKDGLALIPTDEAKDFDVGEMDLKSICDSLSQDDIDLLATEPIEGAVALAKKISRELASNVTPVTARHSDKVLTPLEQGKCWEDFVGAKTASGKSLFPDAENKEVQAQMNTAYAGLAPELKDLAGKNSAALMAVQEILWSKVHRYRQAKADMASRREAKVAEQNKLNKAGLVVSGSGSETSVKGQDVNTSAMTEAERIGKAIEEA